MIIRLSKSHTQAHSLFPFPPTSRYSLPKVQCFVPPCCSRCSGYERTRWFPPVPSAQLLQPCRDRQIYAHIQLKLRINFPKPPSLLPFSWQKGERLNHTYFTLDEQQKKNAYIYILISIQGSCLSLSPPGCYSLHGLQNNIYQHLPKKTHPGGINNHFSEGKR